MEMTVIGRKGLDVLRRRKAPIGKTYTQIDDSDLGRTARSIIHDAAEDFMQGNTHSVHCLYNEFKSAISQRVLLERLLPFEPPETNQVVVDYLYEPSQETVLTALLERAMGDATDFSEPPHRIFFRP